jgi:hypothetical protein
MRGDLSSHSVPADDDEVTLDYLLGALLKFRRVEGRRFAKREIRCKVVERTNLGVLDRLGVEVDSEDDAEVIEDQGVIRHGGEIGRGGLAME